MTSPFLIYLLFILATALVLLAALLYRSLGSRNSSVESRLDALERLLEKHERIVREEMARNREESSTAAGLSRAENAAAAAALTDSLMKRMAEIAGLQKDQLDIFATQIKTLTASTEGRMERLRETVEERLRLIQEDNSRKLEQMRATVDEKLHDTLERRLGESFKLVGERLELVQKGLGEMHSLACGVGDLKKVLTNVKTRGTLGEIQLGSLLEQILAPGQYAANVETRAGSGQRVEFALRLPGCDGTPEGTVWLPIDAKFPQEDYLRLVEAQETGDPSAIADASRQLEKTVCAMGKLIRDKYLDPPNTTDFGIMFLPTEGLFAEVLRRNGLFETLQRDYRVALTGPTTLAALLNSLQLGFRTLAIEKRSSEVWNLLGAVRTEFAKFGVVLDKTRKKLQEAGNQIDQAAVRSRAIEKKLRDVQGLPQDETAALLEMEAIDEVKVLPDSLT